MNLQILLNDLTTKALKLLDWLINLDYSKPRVILSCIAVAILPFTASYILLPAAIIGILLSVSVLFLIEKLPNRLKKVIHDNPLVSDLVISGLATAGLGTFLGTGLVLGLGFIITDVILSVCLPYATIVAAEEEPTVIVATS